MERLQATGAERLLDSLLQAMSENKDLEPDELQEVGPDCEDGSARFCHPAVLLKSVIQAMADNKHLESDEISKVCCNCVVRSAGIFPPGHG